MPDVAYCVMITNHKVKDRGPHSTTQIYLISSNSERRAP